MKHVLVTAALLASSAAAATAAPLTATVYTASPNGFLVDSTLVAGDKDAVLIDAQFDLADAHRLVAQILESKKTLAAVYITHFHPDHYFGLTVVKQAFPKAKLYASAATVAEIKKTRAAKVKQWGGMYAGLIPTDPVVPEVLGGKDPKLTIEGQTLEIHQSVQGDAPDNSYVWIPSTKTLVAGDIVFHGVHVWTAETDPAARKAWIATLDQLAALGATTVIPGHRDPKSANDASAIAQTKAYLQAFDAAVATSKTPAEVEAKIHGAKDFAGLQLDVILQIGAAAQFATPQK